MSSWGSSSYSRRQEPIAYLGGVAVDLTTLLLIVHVVAAIAAAFAFSAGYRLSCYELFIFDTRTFWEGHFWTPLTDPFFHDLAGENIWFVIGMFFFWWFGRDLEFYLGRLNFGLLYVATIVVPVILVLIAAKLFGGPTMVRLPGGAVPANYAMFISFCIVYPGVMFFGLVEARWFALGSVAFTLVVLLAMQAAPAMIPFLGCLGAAYVYLHFCGANRIWDPFEWLEDWKQDRAVRKFEERQKQFIVEEEDFNETVNSILDKIAKEGIQSLTAQEKQKLERARAQLLRREKPKRG